MSKHNGIKELLKSASKYKLQLAAVAAAVCLLAASCFLPSGKTKKAESGTDFSARDYINSLEKELEALLATLDGAGKVRVMITLENASENRYATQLNEKSSVNSGGERTEEYVVIKKGASNEECVVISVSEPRVRGVAVTASGADDANVKKAITETVCAVFDISSADVSVEKMKYEKE